MDDFLKHSAENDVEQAKRKKRMREDWDGLIDDLVQEGVDKGLFADLKGKGKPLNLPSNRFEGGQGLANAILKDNDVPPSWIAERISILNERTDLREQIKRKWKWHVERFEEAAAREKDRLTISWDDFCILWQAQIEALNKRIITCNLKRPSENLEIFKLSLEDELTRAKALRWLR